MTRIVQAFTDQERLKFIATARTHARAKTRFKHRGRNGFGLDCVGLIAVGLTALGRQFEDRKSYGRSPDDDRLREAMRMHFGVPIAGVPRPGDVALMRWDIRPQHVAIFGDYLHGGLSLIHADAMFGAVVEHSFSGDWVARTIEVYRP